MVLLVGPEGVGKSRIAEAFTSRVGDARVLEARCLPSARSTSFLPAIDVVRTATETEGVTDQARLSDSIRRFLGDTEEAGTIPGIIAGVAGPDEEHAQVPEVMWAIRRVLEVVAGRTTTIVVIDGVDRAHPTFLGTLEFLIATGEAPLLVLAMGKSDLLVDRPGWRETPNLGILRVDPLTLEEGRRLIGSMLGGRDLPTGDLSRIVEASGGNPLYLSESIQMLFDEGMVPTEDLPADVRSMAARRIAHRSPAERSIIARASVAGIAPADAAPAGFSHEFLQQVAYESLSVAERAEMHRDQVRLLSKGGSDRSEEREMLLGFHLERTVQGERSLGSPADEIADLAERASGLLGRLGLQALARSDMPAAAGLTERAEALLSPNDPRRLELMLGRSEALSEMGDMMGAAELAGMGMHASSGAGDERLQARFSVLDGTLRVLTGRGPGDVEGSLRRARDAAALFESTQDEIGVARAHELAATICWDAGRYLAAQSSLRRALEWAQAARDVRSQSKLVAWLVSSLFWGPTHVDEGVAMCEAILADGVGDRLARAKCLTMLAGLNAMRGDFSKARELLREASGIQRELGQNPSLGEGPQVAAITEMLAGDYAAAERELRPAYESLAHIADVGFLGTITSLLAKALCEQGRFTEAVKLTELSERIVPPEAAAARAEWVTTRGRILARSGRPLEAESLAREAVSLLDTDAQPRDRADALMDLAEVLRLAGRARDAKGAVEEALILYERKGVRPGIEKATAALEEIGV